MIKPFFSTTPAQEAEVAIRAAWKLLEDPEFRRKARQVAKKAVEYLSRSVEGRLRPKALGRAAELHFLSIALERLESSNDGLD